MPDRLLARFRDLFAGTKYEHRKSNLGDLVAMEFYEDLVDLGRSSLLIPRVDASDWVINTGNRRVGVSARRGDGTFGELVPGTQAIRDPGFRVARGSVATVEIGVEVKILNKAMIKQIDRVLGDLGKQVTHFRRGGGNPITVGIVGVNHSQYTVSYERDRVYRTDGSHYKHPIQEATEAERRLSEVAGLYDHFIVLRYSATNEEPFPFAWVDPSACRNEYAALLVRASREYDQRFR